MDAAERARGTPTAVKPPPAGRFFVVGAVILSFFFRSMLRNKTVFFGKLWKNSNQMGFVCGRYFFLRTIHIFSLFTHYYHRKLYPFAFPIAARSPRQSPARMLPCVGGDSARVGFSIRIEVMECSQAHSVPGFFLKEFRDEVNLTRCGKNCWYWRCV